jgi:hypothetical protein
MLGLFGVRREAHLRLPGNTPRHEAKTRRAEWMANVEARIATLNYGVQSSTVTVILSCFSPVYRT